MAQYTTIGTNNFDLSVVFYDNLLSLFGMKGLFRSAKMRFYTDASGNMLAVTKPYDGGRATVGNGVMFGFSAASRELVDAVHATALANGGTCEGKPGYRTPTMYIAYFRDPDGNKLAAFNMDSADAFAKDAQELANAVIG
jgi:catechol 2,3-dioxygenase-like lactoylglutathione lyase family enzyme